MHNTPDPEEQSYQITPKGLISVFLNRHGIHNRKIINELWDYLAEGVAEIAAANNCPPGVPSLIFVPKTGGVCVTMQQSTGTTSANQQSGVGRD